MKKRLWIIAVLLLSSHSYAGFNGVTHHSRANCANNESISWDWGHNWWFWVNSQHIDIRSGTIVHTLASNWQFTWRNAAVHWGEGRGGWRVHGLHWMKDSRGEPVLVAEEDVNNCSVYDGWWDKNK